MYKLKKYIKGYHFSQLIGTLYNREITLEYEYDDVNDTMVVKRRKRGKNEINYFDMSKMWSSNGS